MNYAFILLSLAIMVACSRKDESSNSAPPPIVAPTPELQVDGIISSLSYPTTGQLFYDGEMIADLSNPAPTVSSFGTVTRGVTLNEIKINGIEFLVYGEDGVFAVECEANADYPDHGPTHSKCEIAHAESYDTMILCNSRNRETSIMKAQNWPGYPQAMTDDLIGMECWKDGVKMKSNRIFTY